MGVYLRRSVRAGPFRFNLSKSGVGVSTGVPGFRVGTGPRGNYIRAGRHGVYYRATLGGTRSRSTVAPGVARAGQTPYIPPPIADVLLEDVTGASAAELVPSGPGDLVEQLNAAGRRLPIAPWLLALLAVALIAKPIVGLILLAPGLPAVVWLWLRDRAKRTVVAFYDVNDDVSDSSGCWHRARHYEPPTVCGALMRPGRYVRPTSGRSTPALRPSYHARLRRRA
jgi:hypothetical protein